MVSGDQVIVISLGFWSKLSTCHHVGYLLQQHSFIRFRVRDKHFKTGDMKLKCTATIATIYWRSNEESVQGVRKQTAFVSESRGTWGSAAIPIRSSASNSWRNQRWLRTIFPFLISVIISRHQRLAQWSVCKEFFRRFKEIPYCVRSFVCIN